MVAGRLVVFMKVFAGRSVGVVGLIKAERLSVGVVVFMKVSAGRLSVGSVVFRNMSELAASKLQYQQVHKNYTNR